jgi:HSP20 family molecular chaperone IbpA
VDRFEDFMVRFARQLVDMIEYQQDAVDVLPFAECVEEDGFVRLTAELSGVKADELTVNVWDRRVEFIVESAGIRQYSQAFNTGRLERDGAAIRFRNGILDVRVPLRKSIF